MVFSSPGIRILSVRLFAIFASGLKRRINRHFVDRKFHFFLLAALSFALLFAKLGQGDLNGYDDAVYAHEGKTMLVTGDWWNVRLNGKLDFDKPPMFIWLEAFSMLIFGVSDFAARFPSALLGFGTILLVYFLARELSDEYWVPVLSMLILMCTHIFMRLSMHAMTDVPFTFFFTLAIYLYVRGLRQSAYLPLCGLAIALAILTRSFLGGIPLAVILTHLLLIKRTNLLRSKYLIAGLVLALGLPMVWFASQHSLHGSEFIASHFSYSLENLPQTDDKTVSQMIFGLLYYPAMLSKNYWPWLPFMVIGFWMQVKMMISGRDVITGLLVIWIVGVIAPFSLIETKALRYILAVFPALAIVAGVSLNRWIPARGRIFVFKSAYVLLLCLSLVLAVLPKYRSRPEEMRRLAAVAESTGSPEKRLLLYAYGEWRWDHLYQVIWYADHHCELITNIDVAASSFEEAADVALILDKEAFSQIIGKLGEKVAVLGESENFVCIAKQDYD